MSSHPASRPEIGRGRQLMLGLFVAVAAFLAVSGLTSVAQAAEPVTNKAYRLSFFHSKKCLDVPGDFNTQSTELQQFTCVAYDAPNELWYIDKAFTDPSGRNFYWIRNKQSNKCVNIAYGSRDAGARVVQYTCGYYTNEYFTFEHTPDMVPGYYRVKNYNSGKCLNVEGYSSANGAKIVQWWCDDLNWTEDNEEVYLPGL